ncbi:ZIP family metal transporter [Natranaerobius trueperi]|uniref:Zinc/iron permease n=1 Tax=Natranaerobius trueperi TaxID=759412 RepID=A0A226BX80_9FIRM|nr:ZIP family metal transporter [Natranaerobius trueperi]OWZ83638.1 zinc/iron permease [Natranaerobius trueperi]
MESLLYSFIAGASTAIGAIIIALIGRPGQKVLSGLLGFAGGIMIAISAFKLIPEAEEISSTYSAVIGFILGAAMMYLLDKLIPHTHLPGGDEVVTEGVSTNSNEKSVLKTGYLIFLGIALHNLPEGLAIGAGLESNPELGFAIAVAIALHNIPEGMAVAGPLRSGGISWFKVFMLTLFAGLMTPVGAAIGLTIFGISSIFVGLGLAFAAGAMVYIVSDELMPMSHGYHNHTANTGFIMGFILGFLIV